MKKVQGIYKISNMANGKFYIGSSIDIKQRWRKHKSDLRKKIHHNVHLQRSWDKYGSENFTFEIIEIVENTDILLEIEQKYIIDSKSYIEKIGYNMLVKDYTRRDNETSEKVNMNKSRSYSGEGNPMYGVVYTEEMKKKISLSRRGKNRYGVTVFDEIDVKEISILFHHGLTCSEIREFYNLGNHVIGNIKKGTNWEDVIDVIDFNAPLSQKLLNIINIVNKNRLDKKPKVHTL